MGGQVGEGGTLLMDAAQLYLFVPIPAKAKKLGLLSIYLFSLVLHKKNVVKNMTESVFTPFFDVLKFFPRRIGCF
jgi:hypothetical protein